MQVGIVPAYWCHFWWKQNDVIGCSRICKIHAIPWFLNVPRGWSLWPGSHSWKGTGMHFANWGLFASSIYFFTPGFIIILLCLTNYSWRLDSPHTYWVVFLFKPASYCNISTATLTVPFCCEYKSINLMDVYAVHLDEGALTHEFLCWNNFW